MKNIFKLLLGVAVLFSATSCSDDDYTSKYDNPAQTSTASCDKLMTGLLYAGREYAFNSYWRMYTWGNGILGKYAQTIGFTNSQGSLYSAQDSYANSRWENFYIILEQWRALNDVYGKETEAKQKEDKIFLDLSEIYLYDHLSQIIDIFGDVPFEKAGYLGITGDVKNSYASYDSASDLYKMMLTRLGEIYIDIKKISEDLPKTSASALPSQDFICKGDLSKWMLYCNDLRLRLAVRVSSQGTLVAEGKQTITEILGSKLPTSETFDDNIYFVGDNSNDFNYSDAIRNGYKDHSHANTAMLNVLLTKETLGMDDYRLPVMYSKNAAGEYKGLSTHDNLDDQTQLIALPESQRAYSRIDSTTVIYNQYFMHPIATTAEAWFSKAECYQQGWATGDAKDAFVKGVVAATQYMYAMNANSKSKYGYTAPSAPDDNDVATYAAKIWDNASNKLEVIGTQKWFNFGFIQTTQAWAELRRTGYPVLYFPEDPTAQILKSVPNRVRYPASERNNNITNYNEALKWMGGTDDAYAKLFWAK